MSDKKFDAQTITRRAFIGGAVSTGMLSALSLSACGPAPQQGGSSSPQELNLDNTDLGTFDVNDIRNINEFLVLTQTSEPLFRTGSDGATERLDPAGAESFTVSEDGLTYTYKLRDNKWSDDKPVTAQHYVDSILRLCDPEKGFSYSFMASDIEGAEKYMNGEGSANTIGVKAVDDKTLEIKLRAPIPFFNDKLANLCFAPIRLDVIEAAGEAYAKDFSKHVWSGPFKITAHTVGQSITLEPNPNFWDKGNIKLQRVNFTEIAEEATKSQLLNSKQLDAVVGTTEYVKQWKKESEEGKLVYMPISDASTDYLAYNMHDGGPSKLMKNAKVRKAISVCIDRDELIEVVHGGLKNVAYGLIPTGLHAGAKEYRAEVPEPLKAVVQQFNTPEKAQTLLAEGLREETGSDDLSKVEFTILVLAKSTQSKTLAEWLSQEIAKKLNVKVKVNAQSETPTFVAERDAHRYDFYVMGWHADFNDPLTFMDLFCTGSGYAKFMGGYSNADFDRDYAALSSEGSEAKRLELYRAMEENLVAENAGISPLAYGIRQVFAQPYVKDIVVPMFGPQLEISRVHIEGK